MYDWLIDSLGDDSTQIVTASRRCARTLAARYAQHQIDAGRAAWRPPAIQSVGDWTASCFDDSDDAGRFVRIGASQSQALWEKCLRADLDDPLLNIPGLARLCRETWRRLLEYGVPLAEWQNRAVGQDQRIFARAAGRYARALENNSWLDDAGLADRVAAGIRGGHIRVPQRLVLTGFDRITPQVEALIQAAGASGCDHVRIDATRSGEAALSIFDNPDAELRAAGAWARRELEHDARLQIGIVVTHLEDDALRAARLLREGLIPGWQMAPAAESHALNVSYGRRLADYPAIDTALLLLRWLSQDLPGREVSRLLRSAFLGLPERQGRCRLDVRMRAWPDRRWSRSLWLGAVRGGDDDGDLDDWLRRLARAGEACERQPRRQPPSKWAAHFDDVLHTMNWPGEGSQSSHDFQLVNRWRDLLNEFARLELVDAELSPAAAVARLGAMAADTLFQPEVDGARVSVLGPLEAAGLEFDRLWVCGATATSWPPKSSPLALVSRDLQRAFGMPDSTPEDTADYASRVLERLRASAPQVMFSVARLDGDEEQSPTALLGDILDSDPVADPGWNATSLTASVAVTAGREPRVVAAPGERLSGGAATIDAYNSDPFTAFARGRLDIRPLRPFRPGIPPDVRGSLIHDALFRLYEEAPTQAQIGAWSESDLNGRIERAIRAAFRRHERSSDVVLGELLRLEKQRTARLLRAVVDIDRGREAFVVDSVENSVTARFGDLQVELRCDRIDRDGSGQFVILDYKTGRERKFLKGGEPANLQLVVYACALDVSLGGLGLFNVDSRCTAINGVGPAFDDIPDWDRTLARWQREVFEAAERIAAGDLRLNVRQPRGDAEPFSLLSRWAEVRHDV